MKIELFDEKKKAFVSYIRENAAEIDKICSEFRKYDIEYWLDRNEIVIGKFWKKAIRDAIKDGAYFLACFSHEYENRDETYMNEELIEAIDILRTKPYDSGWFIPIKLSDCNIPDIEIGAGKTLNDIQCLNLFEDWNERLQQLINLLGIMQPTGEELSINSQFKVEVVEIEFTEEEGELPNPEPLIISKRLSEFGFQVSLGVWDGYRLLSKLPSETINSLYVIHRNNPELSDRILKALRQLKVAPRVVTITTKEVEDNSERIVEDSIVENSDAIIAYRAVA